jgi:FkbM family methyltransferase
MRTFTRVIGVVREEGFQGLWRRGKIRLRKSFRRVSARLWRKDSVRSAYGVRMVPNWGDTTFEYCIFGEYGNYLANYLETHKQPFIFLDIGANQGLYSLIAGKNQRCAQIHAFEPVKDTHSLLSENIALNKLGCRTFVHNYGISMEDGAVPIFITPSHSGKASLYAHADANGSETILIKTAKAVEPALLPGLPIFVKVDVEGHERSVVQSLMDTAFSHRITTIFYEVDESRLDPTDLETILRASGFAKFAKVGDGTHYDVLASR